MGFFESQSKSIDAAIPLALKLQELRRSDALARQKLDIENARLLQQQSKANAANALAIKANALKTVELAPALGLPITDALTIPAGLGPLPRRAFNAEFNEPSEAIVRSQVGGLENLKIDPVDTRSEEEAMFGTPVTKFNVSGQRPIQPVSEATKKLQATIAERLAAAEEKRREFDESQQTRRDLANIADTTRRDLGEANLDLRRDLGEGNNLLRQALIEIQRGNQDLRRVTLESKMSDIDKEKLKTIRTQMASIMSPSDPRLVHLQAAEQAIYGKYEGKPAAGGTGQQAPKFDAKQFPEFEPGSKTKRRIYTDPKGNDFVIMNGARKDITIDAQGRVKF